MFNSLKKQTFERFLGRLLDVSTRNFDNTSDVYFPVREMVLCLTKPTKISTLLKM